MLNNAIGISTSFAKAFIRSGGADRYLLDVMDAISLLALYHPVAASLRGSIFPCHPVACPRDPVINIKIVVFLDPVDKPRDNRSKLVYADHNRIS